MVWCVTHSHQNPQLVYILLPIHVPICAPKHWMLTCNVSQHVYVHVIVNARTMLTCEKWPLIEGFVQLSGQVFNFKPLCVKLCTHSGYGGEKKLWRIYASLLGACVGYVMRFWACRHCYKMT